MKTGEIIKNKRKEQGLTLEELGSMIGVKRATMQRYESGVIKCIPMDKIEAIAKRLNTTPTYLMGWEKNDTSTEFHSNLNNSSSLTMKELPLLNSVVSGKPILLKENTELYLEVSPKVRADFVIRAKGDSMKNARIHDGDIVFVREQPIVKNGEIAVILINNEIILRRIYYKEKTKLVLIAENPKYEPLIYIGKEIEKIKILGKAISFQSNIK